MEDKLKKMIFYCLFVCFLSVFFFCFFFFFLGGRGGIPDFFFWEGGKADAGVKPM